MFGMPHVPRSARPARARRIARLLHALGEPVADAERHGRRLASRVADGPRGERLAILDHRERVEGGGDRGREAWVLRIVLGWSDRDAARAMDCSRSALEGHLTSLGSRFDEEDVLALRHGMAAVDGELGGRTRGGDSRPWRLTPPWRWLMLGVIIALGLDILIQVLQASRH